VYFKTAGIVADCGASIVFSTCRCRHLATSTISCPGALGGSAAKRCCCLVQKHEPATPFTVIWRPPLFPLPACSAAHSLLPKVPRACDDLIPLSPGNLHYLLPQPAPRRRGAEVLRPEGHAGARLGRAADHLVPFAERLQPRRLVCTWKQMTLCLHRLLGQQNVWGLPSGC